MYFRATHIGIILLFVINLVGFKAASQSGLVVKTIEINGDTVLIDTGLMVPGSFQANGLSKDSYELILPGNLLVRKDSSVTGTFNCRYRLFIPMLTQDFYHKDTSLINYGTNTYKNPFKITNQYGNTNFFGSGLNKTGSISRGVSFGNNQNLSVNSNLNLQMSGKIAPDVSLVASVTDDNIPIQPDGNTQQLQDFDQVYIKVFEENKWSLVAGDFWLYKPNGYFMTYKKRAQGGSFSGTVLQNEEKKQRWDLQASGAISRGKFARNIIQGIEGNQGPYRLIGADNEPFIIVLAGTERVYIDGKLLVRGQENDYIMNYNTSEVIFTAKNLITKDRRIIVEFQYSDQNYARSLFQVSNEITFKRSRIWFNAYSEQDSKNQPLQADVGDSVRVILADAGDQIDQAFASSIDTSIYTDARPLYYRIDTTVGSETYTILIHTVSEVPQHYKATFTNVGLGNGNYELQEITAVGRIYRWVAPVAGAPQGTHEPIIQLAPPSRQQMLTSGFEYNFNERNKIGLEAGYSNYDKNTYSTLDSKDNQGLSARGYWTGKKQLGQSKNFLTTKVDMEFVNRNFRRIERFRSVEFERNWNVLNLDLNGDQILGSGSIGYLDQKLGAIQYRYNMFLAGSSTGPDYNGIKNDLNIDMGQKDWKANVTGSFLNSRGLTNTSFLRHKSHLHKDFGKIRISYDDEHELNKIEGNFNGYEFFDWQATIGTSDSSKHQMNVFYRQRLERRQDSSARFDRAAIANHYGGALGIQNRANRLDITLSYRELRILDTTRINEQPENTLVGRIEHRLKVLKGGITASTFYEIGSGLELKREFLYVEVQPGQGVYTWIDYDGDDIKDLNEFEIAAFQDQANYIRVFTPTNEYVKTFTNQFNESIFIKPRNIWRADSGFMKFIGRFSDQFIYRVDRKTNTLDANQLYNPFVTSIDDTALISISSSMRNTFYFNRTNQTFGMDYSFQNVSGKTLLTSGFDSRSNVFHEVRLRWNITKTLTLQSQAISGQKENVSDYVSGRNFSIGYQTGELKLSYQPNIQSRISVLGTYTTKENDLEYGGETADILNTGVEWRQNAMNKGSLTGQINYIYNAYSGESNSTLAYEMLEALNPGQNFTWSLFYQRALSKHLQVNINYNGRKSPGNNTIHSGGVQVRALF